MPFRPLIWCDVLRAIRELRDGETILGVPAAGGVAAVDFDSSTYAPMTVKALLFEGGPALADTGVRADNALMAPANDVAFDIPTTAIAQEAF